MVEHPRAMDDAAALGIVRAPDHPADPRMADRAGAHGAGLERHVERQAGQPIVAQGFGRAAQGDDLGMGRGIVLSDGLIGARRERLTRGRIDDHGADRHLALRRRSFRQAERDAHVGFVVHGRA